MSARRIGIAVVEFAGRYLVGERQAGQVLAGHAEFPGGKCEPDELPVDCAVRECREESGLAVVPLRLLEERYFRYPQGDVELHFWLCSPQNPAEVGAAHQGFRWVTIEQLRGLNFPEANHSVVQRLSAIIP